ncbi:hypothetical protein [uncultured Cloacibacillus sp.]|uniref:hypothetical protein n=1 Tax=uncultured Cloacibacillus sp. TaxID=889794 RepID=UPI00320A747E
MAVKGGDGLIVIPADELIGKISDLMDSKLSEFAQTIKEMSTVSTDDWLKINEFCSTNQMSRSSVYRMVKSGQVEVRELSARNKFYRWKSV